MAGHMSTMKNTRETDISPDPDAEAVAVVAATFCATTAAHMPTIGSLARDIVAALREAGHLTESAGVQWGVHLGNADVHVCGSEQDAWDWSAANGMQRRDVVRRRTGPGPWQYTILTF